MKTKLFILLFLILNISLSAQFKNSMFRINGTELPYQVSYPKDFDENKKYPLIVFLHGAGERGSDNEKQLFHGKAFLEENTSEKYPAIVIAPQCGEDNFWSNVMVNTIADKTKFSFGRTETPTLYMDMLMYLIEDWLSSGIIDTKQVYVGGLSMGGMGTLELLWRMPNTFAAAFPVCGGGDISKVDSYARNTAVWLFHGDADDTVPVKHSQGMFKALKDAKCDVKYSEYPGVKHNSWDNLFQEKDFFDWLFSHTK